MEFEEQVRLGLEFKDWLAHFISNTSAEVVQLFFSICYGIWHARNKLCFDQMEIPIPKIITTATCVVEEMQTETSIQHQLSSVSATAPDAAAAPVHNWSPPPSSCYKLNIDAAGPVDGKWGIGVIVRDCTGFVMAASRWRMDCLNDPAVAEAMALKLGLQFALDLFFINVQVESDSLTVVAAMNSRNSTNNYLGMIIQDCRRLNDQFSSFLCTHIGRDINHAADGLAKSALVSEDMIWIEKVSNCISHFIAMNCSSFQVE